MSLVGLLALNQASAKPITYTGFNITDGKLGNWEFHNARVYLRFESDPTSVQTLNPYPGTDVVVSINTTGDAFITIVTGEKTVTAQFDPAQIFVALDRGDVSSQPYEGGRGVGFGWLPPGGGFEPAYPLGIEDDTIDWGDATYPSPALPALSVDLAHPTAFSGRGWVCVGFPDTTCPMPAQASLSFAASGVKQIGTSPTANSVTSLAQGSLAWGLAH